MKPNWPVVLVAVLIGFTLGILAIAWADQHNMPSGYYKLYCPKGAMLT